MQAEGSVSRCLWGDGQQIPSSGSLFLCVSLPVLVVVSPLRCVAGRIPPLQCRHPQHTLTPSSRTGFVSGGRCSCRMTHTLGADTLLYNDPLTLKPPMKKESLGLRLSNRWHFGASRNAMSPCPSALPLLLPSATQISVTASLSPRVGSRGLCPWRTVP